jgi:hypothetical protein
LDPNLEIKLTQERKLARRLRGTVTKFVQEWFKTDSYRRQELITIADHHLSQIIFEHQQRTSRMIEKRGLPPNYQQHRFDSRLVLGGTVKRLIDFETRVITKSEFKEKLRNWLTRKSTHITQRDIENHRFAYVQQQTNGLVFKAWRSRMDGIERPDHHNAHIRYQTQPIPINEVFLLGRYGFKLRFPGDGALGAGPEQTYNCRCSVDYYDANGKRLNDRFSFGAKTRSK